MVVKSLRLEDFRNLKQAELLPCEGVNVIYGDNAQGKTNLLEGLWLFTGGHSFRGAKDGELPRLNPETGENSPSARLSLVFFGEGREQEASLRIENGRRGCVINGVKKTNGSALVGKVRAVIFSPDHLLLIKEGPARRRSFIDGALCQSRPAFAALLSRYNRALLQRNALLKDMVRFPELRDTLEVWDARLAKFGAAVMRERAVFTEKLAPGVQAVYEGISRGKEKIDVRYSSSLRDFDPAAPAEETEALFLRALSRSAAADTRAGFTSTGPHRDDLEISLNGISARAYGSQGQQRSAVLALKLAEAEALTESSGETPIVLLDDVMSELDRNRQDYLLNHLHGRQVFITCCSPETVSLQETGRRFRMERGSIFPEEIP